MAPLSPDAFAAGTRNLEPGTRCGVNAALARWASLPAWARWGLSIVVVFVASMSLSFAAIMVFGTTTGLTAAGAANSALVPRPEDLDLGTIWAEPSIDHKVQVQNRSGKPVRVNKVVADCSCTQVSPSNFELAPGETQTISTSIDLTRVHGTMLGRNEKEFSSKLTLHVEGAREVDFTIVGKLAYPFVLPDQLRLTGPITLGEVAPATRLSIWKHPDLVDVKVVADNEEAVVAPVLASTTGTSATFDILPKSVRPLGEFTFSLQVSGSNASGSIFGPYTLRASGIVECDVEWGPKSLVLIQGGSAKSVIEQIRIWSRTRKPIENATVTVAPDFLTVSAVGRTSDDSDFPGLAIYIQPKGAASPGKLQSGTVMLRVETASHRGGVQIPIPVTVHSLEVATP